MGKWSEFLTTATVYDANYLVVGRDSTDPASTSNWEMTLPNWVIMMKGQLESASTGLDLDAMSDSNGNQPLSGGQQTTVTPASTSHAVTDWATTNSALDALGTVINNLITQIEATGLLA
jgi:hypothetical protein